jgi:hypothetical protein
MSVDKVLEVEEKKIVELFKRLGSSFISGETAITNMKMNNNYIIFFYHPSFKFDEDDEIISNHESTLLTVNNVYFFKNEKGQEYFNFYQWPSSKRIDHAPIIYYSCDSTILGKIINVVHEVFPEYNNIYLQPQKSVNPSSKGVIPGEKYEFKKKVIFI